MLTACATDALEDSVACFGAADIPVLRCTVDALARLREREDEVVARDISEAILCDPMLTLIVLRTLQSCRPGRQIADITTIEHAIMMLGVSPFFRQFQDLPVVEELLADNPAALRGFLEVAARARHAAMHAKNWAALRCDIASDEVVIAALLHDMAEMMLWFLAPRQAAEIAARMKAHPALRSAAVQLDVLGFRIADLQSALSAEWRLPDLLQSLMDEQHADRPRARNALLAVALARHSAHGWSDAALFDDVEGISDLLGLTLQEAREVIYMTELAAIEDSERREASGLAIWLPPAPVFAGERQDPPPPSSPCVDPCKIDHVMARFSAPLRPGHSNPRPSGRRTMVSSNMARIDTIALRCTGYEPDSAMIASCFSTAASAADCWFRNTLWALDMRRSCANLKCVRKTGPDCSSGCMAWKICTRCATCCDRCCRPILAAAMRHADSSPCPC